MLSQLILLVVMFLPVLLKATNLMFQFFVINLNVVLFVTLAITKLEAIGVLFICF